MTRGEAIKALIAGKKVERFNVDTAGESIWPLRWDDQGGLLVLFKGHWVIECGFIDSNAGDFKYREIWEPRIFLDVWEEVRTFEEAEPAGAAQGRPLAVYVDKGGFLNTAPVEYLSGYWAKRKAGK